MSVREGLPDQIWGYATSNSWTTNCIFQNQSPTNQPSKPESNHSVWIADWHHTCYREKWVMCLIFSLFNTSRSCPSPTPTHQNLLRTFPSLKHEVKYFKFLVCLKIFNHSAWKLKIETLNLVIFTYQKVDSTKEFKNLSEWNLEVNDSSLSKQIWSV